MKFNKLLLVFVAVLFLYSCKDKEEVDIKKPEVPEKKEESEQSKVNKFIYKNMSFFYFWEDESNIIEKKPSADYNPHDYFQSLLYKQSDRWSFLVDDVKYLEDLFSGIQTEFGYRLVSGKVSATDNTTIAVVTMLHPNSPASKKGLKRGDIIFKVDGEKLTRNNINNLYSKKSISITLATLGKGNALVEGKTINLKQEVVKSNPIYATNIFEINGKKVGYLAYNSFIYNEKFNKELEDVFANFKNNGVTELILDLRYNGGGDVRSAQLIDELIFPATTVGKVFKKASYNTILTRQLKKEKDSEHYFTSYFSKDVNSNNLNLSDLYVITTRGTASASEMVIYTLAPYMNVHTVGTTTHGKYYASITIKDKEKKLNWAIQPIILRSEGINSIVKDYSQGIAPTYYIEDNYKYPLGSKDEVLTKFTLDIIAGITPPSGLKSKHIGFIPSKEDLMINPFQYDMHEQINLEK